MVECPNCSSENAYHNGVEYICPDCDNEWGSIDDEEEDEDWVISTPSI